MPIKKSSSGQQIQFITDQGEIYFTSHTYLKNFLYNPKQVILDLKKYPNKIPEGKFKPSEVYDPSGYYKKLQEDSDRTGIQVDSLNVKHKKAAKEEEANNVVFSDF